ncbi:transcriptional regulator SplA domain-containing protein [Metabacillus sp. 84]|uniref:transcriptional regulator SplA domain-containing protein n=1 Tax=unclassified Metabacillus TaxID=2675274 RepID=UPI003CF0060A
MEHREDEKQILNIDPARLVQHPKNKDGAALFLKESYHLLSEEDVGLPSEDR